MVKKTKKEKMKIQALSLLLVALAPLFLCNCGVMYASKVGPDGSASKFYTGAVGGKTGVTGVKSDAITFDAYAFDGERSLRDTIIGAATAYIGNVVGSAYEAAQAAKTAQHAATTGAAVANAKTAANVANTARTAELIKDVGIPGEVGIGTVLLPKSP
jgi:hypothetical protein